MSHKISSTTFIFLMFLSLAASIIYIFTLKYLVTPHYDKNDLYTTLRKPLTSEVVRITLTLANPDDNLLVNSPNLLVQGKTLPNIAVLLSKEKEDLIIYSSNSGDFSTVVDLAEGLNQFSVNVFDDKGNSKTESRTVFYSKEKI